ncbi:MAG: autotransporter outer membrane beta-barrel domain-containing protein [Parvibaculales bacterium]
MDFKSRLLRSAFILPLSAAMAWAPVAHGFELTGDEDDTEYTASVATSSNPSDGESIIINGSPTGTGNAALLVDDDTAIIVDGAITVRDRDGDTAYTLNNAIGIDIANNVTSASGIRLKDGDISIIEVRGPEYDGDDDDSLPDANDDDEDGIIEGSPALAGDNTRIGLRVQSGNTITGPVIAENGSSITVEGNAASVGDVAGVKIDGTLSDDLELWTIINVRGDQARGVDINGTIGGNYRQRGPIDVRGEDTVGIDVGAAMTGSLMIEGHVNATGYSAYSASSNGAPRRGGEDTDDTDEFDATRRAANPDERRQSEAAVKISSAINGGVIVGGTVNRAQTRDEFRDFSCDVDDSDCSDDGINIKRADGQDVTSLKTDPFHYDENRGNGRLTSYGESAATLLIANSLGTSAGSTVETFLDTTDDDNDDDPDVSDDEADLYDSSQEFFFSHGLMNRGSIEANGLYDSVNNGSGYSIDLPATALKLDEDGGAATIHGGIFNSGTISATAYNADAIAVDLHDGTLTDGLRADDTVFLNEGTIRATIATHTKSYSGVTKSSNQAVAVKVDSTVAFQESGGGTITTPQFINAGAVSAASIHTQLNTETSDDDDYETVTGEKAIAFDLSAISGNFDLTQRMRAADMLVDASAARSNTNPFRGSGDLDIDRSGDTDEVDDSTVTIGDGKIDTRDVTAPSIVGDVKFGGGANSFTVHAGTVTGDIDFGAGSDSFLLGNSMADDENDANDDDDDYTAPTTTFRGAIKNTGTLDITLGAQFDSGATQIDGEKTRLHFVGQEGRDLNDDGDDSDANEEFEGLAINDLELNEAADLRFTINPDLLSNEVLDVTNLTLSASATISPFISTLISSSTQTVDLVSYTNITNTGNVPIADRLEEDGHPLIYKVSLKDESNTISAEFTLKTATELGMNKNEAAAYPAVISHFRNNDALEAAITQIDDKDDFDAYYGQLLPHYGDGTMRQLSGLADAATGAVGQHLQIVNAGGRRGGDGWAQQFGDYRKQDGTGETGRISGTSYGLAAGYDAPAGVVDALGMYAQMSFTSVHEKPVLVPNALTPNRDEVRAESFGFGAYMADRIGPLSLELNGATSSVTFDSTRSVNFNGVTDVVAGSWDATSYAASARLAYPILDLTHLLRLEVGFDHFALEQDGYSERTGRTADPELAMQLSSAESDMTSQFIGLRGGYVSGGGSSAAIVWEPNYYIGYRSVSDYTPYKATANFVGSSDSFTLLAQDEPTDSVDVGFGLAAHNEFFAFDFNYRGKFGDGEEMHGGGISIRLLF